MRQIRPLLPISMTLLLLACTPQPPLSVVSGKVPAVTVANRPAAPLTKTQGSPTALLNFSGSSRKLSLHTSGEAYKVQAADCASAAYFRVSLTGFGIAQPLYADGADPITHMLPTNGCTLNANVSDVPLGPGRIVTIELFDSALQPLTGATLQSAMNLGLDAQTVEISFRQLVLGRVANLLLAQGVATQELLSHLDLVGLQTFLDQLLGVSGSFPDYQFTVHPSLVNLQALANDLIETDGVLANLHGNYLMQPATLRFHLAGLQQGHPVTATVDDPLSLSMTAGSNQNEMTNIAPGDWTLTLAGAGYTTLRVPVQMKNGETLDLGTLDLDQNPPLIESLSHSSGKIGDTVRIIGTHLGNADGVTFNGIPATYHVISETEVEAIVPARASDGVITVTNAHGAGSSAAFDVTNRVWFVNDDATGSNDGSSWANAMNSLQTALSTTPVGDEIWVAAGTYKPHQNDRNASFVLKTGIPVYGGFAATERDKGQRNISANTTSLSGDLAGNDTTQVTPDEPSRSENSYHVVMGGNGTVLEGVTIQGGNANGSMAENNHHGGGMLTYEGNLQLRQVVFINNTGQDGAGMANIYRTSAVLSQVRFEHNVVSGSAATPGHGGGMLNDLSSPSLDQVVFVNNAALGSKGSGGGMYNRQSSPLLTKVVFMSNQAEYGGGLLNEMWGPTLNNVVFANNQATYGGAMLNKVYFDYYHIGSSPILNHVTFSNNVSANGGAINNQLNLPPYEAALSNVLFWNNDLLVQNIPAAAGNVIASSDPFVDSLDPDGPDNLWFTQDDGLRLRSDAAEVVNQGVSSALRDDILGQSRGSNPDSGAYEFSS